MVILASLSSRSVSCSRSPPCRDANRGHFASGLRLAWGSASNIDALVLPSWVTHPVICELSTSAQCLVELIASHYLGGHLTVWVDSSIKSLVLHVQCISVRVIPIKLSLLTGQPSLLLQKRVFIELLLQSQLPQELGPCAPWADPTCDLLNGEIDIPLVWLSEDRVWRNTLVDVYRLVASGDFRHGNVVLLLISLLRWTLLQVVLTVAIGDEIIGSTPLALLICCETTLAGSFELRNIKWVLADANGLLVVVPDNFALILVHSGEDGVLLMLDSAISIYGRLGSWGDMERLRWKMHWSHPIVVLTWWPKSANRASALLLHETLLKVDGCLVDLVQFFTFYLLCDLDIVEKLL